MATQMKTSGSPSKEAPCIRWWPELGAICSDQEAEWESALGSKAPAWLLVVLPHAQLLNMMALAGWQACVVSKPAT